MVDAVVCYWISLVIGVAGGQDKCGQEVIHRNAFLFVDDGLVVSTDMFWLQVSFDTLAGFFDRLVIGENSSKIFGMLCRPCCAFGTQSEAVY